MTTKERNALRRKYDSAELRKIRALYDRDVEAWAPVLNQYRIDMQCISTDQGPWPDDEWKARTTGANKRAALHEDVLTPYVNQVVNKIDQNPMGVECQPSGDGATAKSAERLENRIRQIEYEENAPFAYQCAVLPAVQASFGWWKMETRYAGKFAQRVCITPVMDPTTITAGFFKKPDASDMRRAWEHEWMSFEEFRSRWKNAAISSFEGLKDAGSAWANDTAVQVCAWWHLESDERELFMIDGPDGLLKEVYASDVSNGPALDESKIRRRRTEKRDRVVKTIMSGCEVLDETEWIDPGECSADGEQLCRPEIPLFGVFGRIKYKDNRMVIESLVRKGRMGQLLYDYTISAIQETIGLTPRVTRSGPEGTFDTSTNWDPKAVQAYKEWKPVVDPETGQVLPAPVVETYEPPIAALEMAKDSILRGIANAIGMSAVEKKDKTAKSGKALDALMQEMTVGTSHYFGALRIAQERGYRILQRIVPVLEQADQEVGFRDKFGKSRIERLPENAYSGRYSIAVGTGKLYQTLQEKQEELSQELLLIKDPTISLAVLPGAIRMRGCGPEADTVADMIEAMQPPQMQQARNKDEQQAPIPPEVQQGIQQMQEQMKSMDAYAKEAEAKIIELTDKLEGQVVQNASKETIAAEDNATKIELQRMKDEMEMKKLEFEFRMKELELEIEKFRAETMLQKTDAELTSKEGLTVAGHQHSESEAERGRQHTSEEAERGRKHEASQAEAAAT